MIEARIGAKIDTQMFPTAPSGLSRGVAWIGRRTSGLTDVVVAINGIGSDGAGLARCCQNASYRAVESFPPPARQRRGRGRGKSDEIDAALIARSVLSADTEQLRDPRQDTGIRAALRVLISARDLVNLDRTRSINALPALLRTVDLDIDARTSLTVHAISGGHVATINSPKHADHGGWVTSRGVVEIPMGLSAS